MPDARAHSLAKLRLIAFYLQRYFETISVNPKMDALRVTFVDGFCGGGSYNDRGQEVSGSPLMLLGLVEEAQQVLNENRAKRIEIKAEFYFVDRDKDAIDTLRAKLMQEGHLTRLNKDIHIQNSDFQSAYPTIKAAILARTRNMVGRSVFVLDQKGYTDAPIPIVRDILKSFTGSEVILTFAVGWLIDYLSENPQTARAVSQVGLTDQQIQEYIQLKEKKGGRIIIERLLLQHLQSATGASFASPFFVRSEEANKDLWIVHLSNHMTARNVMVEGHWKLKNHSLHFGTGGLEIMGFNPKLSPEAAPDFWFGEYEEAVMRDRLAEDVMRRLRDGYGESTVGYLGFLADVANETPARRIDFDSVATTLVEAKELRLSDAKGQPRRSSRPNKRDLISINPQASFHFMNR